MRKLFLTAATLAFVLGSSTGIAAGDASAGKGKSATCSACHGADGNSTDPQNPKLAAQHAGYTVKQLQEFKGQVRENAVMLGMVAALSDQDMEDLAAYYAGQQISPGVADAELVALGEALYRGGDLTRGIAACSACHGPSGNGNPGADFPKVAGQHAQYTESQLKAFRSMQRANDSGQMMRNVAVKLTDADIQALSSYIQGLRD
jgi:cytochrome c553